MKFFKAIVYGHSVPLDADEVEKVTEAIIGGQSGVLVLKRGVIDLRSPVHIAPDEKREDRYMTTPYDDEKKAIKTSNDLFPELRKRVAEGMRMGSTVEKKLIG